MNDQLGANIETDVRNNERNYPMNYSVCEDIHEINKVIETI